MSELIALDGLTMTSFEIAELVDSRHDKVKQSIERLVERGVIVQPPLGDEQSDDAMGRPRTTQVYIFTGERGKRDSIVVVAQLSPEFTARLVDRWQELESKASARALPRSYAEALRLYADEVDAREQAEALRDEAIRTKAMIGSRREATAMNTASRAVMRANRLEEELDKAKDYATIKRMEMLYHGQKFDWRRLKSASTDIGINPIEVFDANYGTVKAYHAEAWRESYALEIMQEKMAA
jgi:phage regulator Rha-like protein